MNESLKERLAIRVFHATGLTHWAWCNAGTKEFYRERAKEILFLFIREVRKIGGNDPIAQAIIKELEVEDES